MGKAKKLSPLEDPPNVSSSDEEEEEEEEEEISEEEEPKEPVKKKAKTEIASSSKEKKRKGKEVSKEMHSKKKPKPSPSFQRLWSEGDEIALLQGMIDFKANTDNSPYESMDVFYEIAMKSICSEASKNQFTKKIRSLKKYMGKVNKGT